VCAAHWRRCSMARGKARSPRVWRKTKRRLGRMNARSVRRAHHPPHTRGTVVVCGRQEGDLDLACSSRWACGGRGQKVLLAIRHGRGERSGLAGVAGQPGLARHEEPELVSSMAVPALIGARQRLWPEAPVQRCTVQQARNLLAHAPERLHEEISGRLQRHDLRQTSKRLRRDERPSFAMAAKCAAIADSLEERRSDYSPSRASRKPMEIIRTTNAIDACTRNSSGGSKRKPSCQARKPPPCSSGRCWLRDRSYAQVDGWPSL